jgi:hypothetical protein
MLEVMGMADMLTLANEAGAAHLVIFNDVGPEKAITSARKIGSPGRRSPSHRQRHQAGKGLHV